MPLEGSVPGAPSPSDVANAGRVEVHRASNMYFAAIGFINDVKKGPFWEHSPILFDISGIRDGWGKINKGMLKMFDAEVLGKFPVVQHFPFGSLFSWEVDGNSAKSAPSVHTTNQPAAVGPSSASASLTGTVAPWAQAATGLTATSTAAARAPPLPAFPKPQGAEDNLTEWQDSNLLPEGSIPAGERGTTSAQHSITKAPWAK